MPPGFSNTEADLRLTDILLLPVRDFLETCLSWEVGGGPSVTEDEPTENDRPLPSPQQSEVCAQIMICKSNQGRK